MPQQITKTIYSYKELIELAKAKKISSSAVEKVRFTLAEWATSDEWYEYVYDMWKEALEQVGFTEPDINFTGFASQGDGASFTSNVDLEKLLWYMTHKVRPKDCIEPTKRTGKEEDFLPWIAFKAGRHSDPSFRILGRHLEKFGMKVKRTDSRYYHESSCDIEMDYYEDLPKKANEVLTDFEKAVEELRLDLCRAIYKSLEDEYYALRDDEVLLENDEANEYKWNENGDLEK